MPTERRPRLLSALLWGLASIGCAGFSASVHPPLDPPSAVSEGVRQHVWRFESRDGLALFARSWAPTALPPKATLVVVHGLVDHSGRYDELGRALALRGYEVRAFDLRGHANSEGDRAYVHRFADWVDDLDRFVRQTRAQVGERPLFLFGHGAGGAVVVEELLDHRPKVSGVLLSAAALELHVGWFAKGATKTLAFFAPRLALLSLPPEKLSRDPSVVAALQADPLIVHGKEPAQTAAELLRAAGHLQDNFEKVTVPLLILHGTADAVTSPRGSEQLQRRARSPDKTLKLYPGFFHDLLHEPGHAEVIAELADWLDRHCG